MPLTTSGLPAVSPDSVGPTDPDQILVGRTRRGVQLILADFSRFPKNKIGAKAGGNGKQNQNNDNNIFFHINFKIIN